MFIRSYVLFALTLPIAIINLILLMTWEFSDFIPQAGWNAWLVVAVLLSTTILLIARNVSKKMGAWTATLASVLGSLLCVLTIISLAHIRDYFSINFANYDTFMLIASFVVVLISIFVFNEKEKIGDKLLTQL
ncbi:MAG TPA: hypothetical protein DCL21_05550 [Alphaproteobacteria bacterium]|nr:hypothetical protein [Alphaproteobacteria bacterium]